MIDSPDGEAQTKMSRRFSISGTRGIPRLWSLRLFLRMAMVTGVAVGAVFVFGRSSTATPETANAGGQATSSAKKVRFEAAVEFIGGKKESES